MKGVSGAEIDVPVEVDDIDHFGNRRIRSVGELIQNQVRTGLSRMERVVRERMTTQDVEAITPQTLINIRPVVASIKEFFGTSQLSQFMDQNNPLAGLTHKRRLNALGPGGLSRDRARWRSATSTRRTTAACARSRRRKARTSASSARSPASADQRVRLHRDAVPQGTDGVVTDEVHYLSADEEDKFVVAQANAAVDDKGRFVDDRVLVRPRAARSSSSPATTSTTWTSRRARWCRPRPR